MEVNFYCIKNQNYKCTHSLPPNYCKGYILPDTLTHDEQNDVCSVYSYQHCLYQMCLTYNGLIHNFFDFYNSGKLYTFSGSNYFKFWSFARLDHLLMLDSCSVTKLPVTGTWSTRVNNQCSYNHSVPYNYCFHFQYTIQ